MRITILFFCYFLSNIIIGQEIDSAYLTPTNKAHLMKQIMDLPCGVKQNDNVKTICQKLEKYLLNYKSGADFPHDKYAKAANLQALKSVKMGGYGIGAVIFENKSGKILHASHNKQLTHGRSDLHGEMSLLNEFESNPANNKYRNKYTCKEGLTVFTSAEPCPMCFIRIATVGVETLYCTAGPDDGITQRVQCLPTYWRELASKHSFAKAKSSPEMQMIAHVLFYSYMLDGRHNF